MKLYSKEIYNGVETFWLVFYVLLLVSLFVARFMF